ncbi:MAG: ProQ/FINO family protein [Thiolinea sp.]
MSKPRKRLSLKPKPPVPILQEQEEEAPVAARRSGKRIIKRNQLPANKLAQTKAPPKPQPKPRKARPTPQQPTTSPSDLRAEALNDSLNDFEIWRTFKPLALGIDKTIFQHIAAHQLSASKRVVQSCSRHCHDRRYLKAVQNSECRYHLDGQEANPISQEEKNHAARTLAGQQPN